MFHTLHNAHKMTFGAPQVGVLAAHWALFYFTLCVLSYIVHSVRILQTQILQNAQMIILVPRRWVLALHNMVHIAYAEIMILVPLHFDIYTFDTSYARPR